MSTENSIERKTQQKVKSCEEFIESNFNSLWARADKKKKTYVNENVLRIIIV